MENTPNHHQHASWHILQEQKKNSTLLAQLTEAPKIEVAEFLATLHFENLHTLFKALPLPKQGEIFGYFSENLQQDIYHNYTKKEFALLFSDTPSDIRADFYQALPDKEQAKLLPYLSKKIKEDVITLSAYPPTTAGGIMRTDFATLLSHMTAQEAMQKLKEDGPSKKMIYYLYVLNHNMKMLGFVDLRDVIMTAPNTKIETFLHENFTYATVYEDQESVAQKIEKYNLVALPVLNDEMQLVGIVSHDDAMDVLREEHTEDMEKFMGILPGEEETDYLDISSIQHFKKRVIWILGLFIASFLSGYILKQRMSLLINLPLFMLYMPMMADTGGNAGSQAAAVIIRALTLRQITLRHWLRIFLKETKVGLLLSVCIFFLVIVKVLLLSGYTLGGQQYLYQETFTIALALSLQVITATLIGSALPLFIKWCKGDPAVAASPAITTIVDITGLLIYFYTIMTCLPNAA